VLPFLLRDSQRSKSSFFSLKFSFCFRGQNLVVVLSRKMSECWFCLYVQKWALPEVDFSTSVWTLPLRQCFHHFFILHCWFFTATWTSFTTKLRSHKDFFSWKKILRVWLASLKRKGWTVCLLFWHARHQEGENFGRFFRYLLSNRYQKIWSKWRWKKK